MALTIGREQDNSCEVGSLCEHECVKIREVASADAVVHPWAVVVEPVNAGLTNCTMSASRSSNDLAVRTETRRLEILQELSEVEALFFPEETGILLPDDEP